jgi:pyruvate kinase
MPSRRHPPFPSDAAAEARVIAGELRRLRTAISAAAARRLADWEGVPLRPTYASARRNLALYLALREADLRPLQPRLAALGLSSLGRCEAQVEASLDAVSAALARISGDADPPPFAARRAFAVGPADIARRRDRMFGPGTGGRVTRIMATLAAEAASDPAPFRRLVAAGVDCVRINCAHDTPEVWRALAAHARAAGEEAGRRVPVSMDIAGPKVRLRGVREGGVRFRHGDRFEIAAEPAPKQDGLRRFGLSHPELLPHLLPGAAVWVDDGKLRGRVAAREGAVATVEVTDVPDKGAKVKPGKGIAVPGADLRIPVLTGADLLALDTIVTEADVVALSFVQRPEDITRLIAEIDRRRGDRPRPAILLKIETGRAVRALPDLIVTAAGAAPVGVMIARGDLAVDVGFERLSELQDEILWLCEAARIPVVWATQVLDGLLHDGLATRAEASDAALSQRADCVMLNKGPHLPEAVAFLAGVLTRMDRHQSKKVPHLAPLGSWRRKRI